METSKEKKFTETSIHILGRTIQSKGNITLEEKVSK